MKTFLFDIKIVGMAIQNDVLRGSDNELEIDLLNVVKNIYNVTKSLGISDDVQLSIAHPLSIFVDSFPLICLFKDGVAKATFRVFLEN